MNGELFGNGDFMLADQCYGKDIKSGRCYQLVYIEGKNRKYGDCPFRHKRISIRQYEKALGQCLGPGAGSGGKSAA